MDIIRGDLEISINTVTELLKRIQKEYDKELEELPEGYYDTDCPSHWDFQTYLECLVLLNEEKEKLDKHN